MSWRALRWWLAGAAAYVVFLLATLPATYAAGWLQHQVPQLQLAGIRGSVWTGSAQEILISGDSWGQVQWQFDWPGLFAGHPGFGLTLRGSGMVIHGRVAGSSRHLLLRGIQGHLAIQRLEPWLPLPAGAASGELQLDLDRVTLVQDRPVAADGTITLTQAALHWPQPVALGSYQLRLDTRTDSGITGTLLDTSGPLALQGSLQLRPDGHYEISGTLASRDAADTSLNSLLGYLPTDAAGSHHFSFSGQW